MKHVQRSIGSQFARPHGPLGRLVARMMRRGNAPLNLWMVDLLEVAWTCSRTGSVFGKIFLRTACAFRHGYVSVKVSCLCCICLTQAMQPYKFDITMCFGGDVFLPKNGTCP